MYSKPKRLPARRDHSVGQWRTAVRQFKPTAQSQYFLGRLHHSLTQLCVLPTLACLYMVHASPRSNAIKWLRRVSMKQAVETDHQRLAGQACQHRRVNVQSWSCDHLPQMLRKSTVESQWCGPPANSASPQIAEGTLAVHAVWRCLEMTQRQQCSHSTVVLPYVELLFWTSALRE